MKNINNVVTVLNYDGIIQESKSLLLLSSITGHPAAKAVLVSLKNAKYDKSHTNLALLTNKLNKLTKTIDTIIGFVDYDNTIYELLKILTKKTGIKLFRNLDTAKLFLNPTLFKKSLNILLYDEDKENTEKLSSELSKYGYTITTTNDMDEFKKLMNKKKYEFTVTKSILNLNLIHKKENKASLPLSKKLISTLPIFMDIAVETLVTVTGLTANKISHSISNFNKTLTNNTLCSLMRFKGDLKGSFVLVFPKETALVALEALLGEKINENDNENIMDGIGEFCNMITGSTKTSLSKKDMKILFELPRTYSSLQQVYNEIGEDNGIWINMQLSGKPFYMFITK